jgi:hypothetical protein
MNGKRPFMDYLRQAFYNYYNYGVLTLFGGLTVINLLGGSPDAALGCLLVGSAVEGAFLLTLVTNARFQRHVDSVLEDVEDQQIDKLRDALWPSIETPLRKRYQDLESLTARLRKDIMSFSQLRDPMLKDNVRKVSTLLASYLKLCVAITRYRGYLGTVDEDQVQRDIERLENEASKVEARIASIKEKNIDILKKRLDKIVKAKTNVDYLSAQLETIEDTMRLVVDQAITLSDPKGMSTQIDTLLDTLNDTELLAAEIDAYDELDQGFSTEMPEIPVRRREKQ